MRVAVDGAIGRLTLDRPAKLNALSGAVLEELIAAAAWFDARPEVRAVIVAGEGRAFTAGADVTEFAGGDADTSWTARRERTQLGGRMADAVAAMRAVTVAALHGHVVGGGVVLAAACDLRLAAEGTVFVIPEVDLGIPLGWGGIPRLVAELGPARTKELVMTCRPFSAEEAQAWGFVNRVVPAAELAAAATELVGALAAKPAVPVTVTKEHVNAVARAASSAGFSFADGDALLAALEAPESQAARRAYLEALFGSGGGPSPQDPPE